MDTAKKSKKREYAPARTPQAKENQMISLAFSLAEKKLRDGSASSQLITHFLKLATVREELENEKLRAELEVASAKVKRMESQTTGEELYKKALDAFRTYSGTKTEEEDDCDDE